MTRIAFGGDYNPEHWPAEVHEADRELFDAARIDTLTLGVFDWSLLQPDEDTYDFSVLDAVLDGPAVRGRRVVLATATAAMPPWLGRRYPGAQRVDFEGRRHRFGQRHAFCPSDPDHRRLATALASRLGERYRDRPEVVAWHVGNEYGGGPACYCDSCAAGFRRWLRERYGDLDGLNAAWYTTFWSHVYRDWDEVLPPSMLTEHWRDAGTTAFQGITLDYRRFASDAMLECYLAEKDALRAAGCRQPVTTNLMGPFPGLDYFRWGPHLDVVSWDCYPPDPEDAGFAAFGHDLMRGVGGGRPFWLMEQSPSMTACRDVNPLRRPGSVRRHSHLAVAHGADAVMFFQMRRNRGASEVNHGAVVDHGGRSDTRVFREVAALGAELEALGDGPVGAATRARVALVHDWDSWWAQQVTDGPSRLVDYRRELVAQHGALRAADAEVDVVPVDADLSGYALVVAPLLQLVTPEAGARFTDFVAGGGTLVVTPLAGRGDAAALAHPDGPPGPLREVLGLRVEETDALAPPAGNRVLPVAAVRPGGAWSAAPEHASSLVFDLVRTEGAEAVGVYGDEFYAGTPAVTRHRHGAGEAWYLATLLAPAALAALYGDLLAGLGVAGHYAGTAGLEASRRYAADGTRWLWLLNHTVRPLRVPADRAGRLRPSGRAVAAGEVLELGPGDVAVLVSPAGE